MKLGKRLIASSAMLVAMCLGGCERSARRGETVPAAAAPAAAPVAVPVAASQPAAQPKKLIVFKKNHYMMRGGPRWGREDDRERLIVESVEARK